MAKKTFKPEPGPGVKFTETTSMAAARAGKEQKMPPDVELAALRDLRGDLTMQMRLQLRVESELDDLAAQTKGKWAERDAIVKNIAELITAPLGGKLPFPPAEEKDGE